MRTLRRLFTLGALAGIGYAIWRAVQPPERDRGPEWEAAPFPFPPVPRPEAPPAPPAQPDPAGVTAPPATPWVEPAAGACPGSHPVKAKLSSGIFHVPGGRAYDRTRPDRCYCDEAAAEADGLRRSKV